MDTTLPAARRRKPGPKEKPPHEQRTWRIPVRVSARERAIIAGRAASAGLPSSVYLRVRGLGGDAVASDSAE